MTHQPGWFVRSMALVTALCLFGSGCVANKTVRADFYRPPDGAPGAKLPLKIALLPDKTGLDQNLRFSYQEGHLSLGLRPGLVRAMKQALLEVFAGVTVIDSPDQAGGVDFLVVAAPRHNKIDREHEGRIMELGIDLDFKDPIPRNTVLRFSRRAQVPKVAVPMAFSVLASALPFFLIAINAGVQSSRGQRYSEDALRSSLHDLVKDLRGGRLTGYLAAQKRAEEAEDKGDAAQGREAFDHYAAALRHAGPGSGLEHRLREKYLKVASSLDNLPPVSGKARRHMIRGQAMFKKLKDKEGYGEVVAEFEKAVRVAPWWPEAYFNLALMQEKAGDPRSAMRNLKLYLVAKPRARDAGTVNRKIIELELKVEEAEKK